jgi:iron(III) transport system substrate-binding protein
MYNTAGSTNAKFTNVWQLTESSYKGKIYFKSPANEQVNMNFLIMLTNDSWSKKLESAYKSKYSKDATDVGDSKTYKNYGYKWIAEFLANCNFSINSDTTIAQDLSKDTNAGNMGLFVLSKLRDSSVIQANLKVSAWDKDSSDNYVSIDPFAGFMYSIYAQLVTNGPRPYTGMLFINYLMTKEGFSPWASIGGYSANTSIPVSDSEDKELSFWKERLVVEDGAYIASVKGTVQDWITAKLPASES